jgi:TorA maturation chaperone TorD
MEKEKLMLARMMIYSDLARCFYYPTEDVSEFFNSGELKKHRMLYQMMDVDTDTFLNDLEAVNRDAGSDFILQLQKEYTRLFVTSRPNIPAPPYGSLYLDKEGMIWGKTTRELVKLYALAGLIISEQFKDLPDHFAVELEFAFYLIREKMAALGLGNGEENQEEINPDPERVELISTIENQFLENYLLKWGSKFLDNILSSTDNFFYKGLAAITKNFLAQESKRVMNKESI